MKFSPSSVNDVPLVLGAFELMCVAEIVGESNEYSFLLVPTTAEIVTEMLGARSLWLGGWHLIAVVESHDVVLQRLDATTAVTL